MRKSTFSAAALFSICAAAAAQAGPSPQGAAQQAPRQPRPIAVEQLTPNVYWVRNIGFGAFIVGDKGVIVLDTGDSPATGKQILDAVAKVTPKPVTTLILSHGDADHVNGIAAFPAGIEIIAQENTKKRLAAAVASPQTGPEDIKIPADRLPNHIVGNREDVQIDGVKMQLLHWAPAHTSGDLVAYLPDQKLVLAGDLLVADQHNLPLIHVDYGGTSKGWIESVKGMLALDADRYVIGHEAVLTKDGVQQQLQAAIAEREKVKALYDKGTSLADIEAAVGDPAPNPNPAAAPKGGPHFPPFSAVIYQELKARTY